MLPWAAALRNRDSGTEVEEVEMMASDIIQELDKNKARMISECADDDQRSQDLCHGSCAVVAANENNCDKPCDEGMIQDVCPNACGHCPAVPSSALEPVSMAEMFSQPAIAANLKKHDKTEKTTSGSAAVRYTTMDTTLEVGCPVGYHFQGNATRYICTAYCPDGLHFSGTGTNFCCMPPPTQSPTPAPTTPSPTPSPTPVPTVTIPPVDDTVGCGSRVYSGGQTQQTYVVQLRGSKGTLRVWYDMYYIPDEMTVVYEGQIMWGTGALVSGEKTVNVNIDGTDNFVYVVMNAPRSGTAWRFEVSCPDE